MRTRVLFLVGALFLVLTPVSVSRAAENSGNYQNDELGFSVAWDPEEFALATVVTGGILLSSDAAVLFIGPDRHDSPDECLKARVAIDMLDAPLLFAYAYELPRDPDVVGLGSSQAAVYAWPDGIVHFAWFGCIPLESGGNIVLRLLARTENWVHAVALFDPILAAMTYEPLNSGTPVPAATATL